MTCLATSSILLIFCSVCGSSSDEPGDREDVAARSAGGEDWEAKAMKSYQRATGNLARQWRTGILACHSGRKRRLEV